MAFQKGQSGNPGGRSTEKLWRDAVRLATHRLVGDLDAPHPAKSKIIEILAHKLVLKALDGDVPALKEIGDRLDGRPAQSLLNDDESGPLKMEITWATRSGS